MSEIKVSIIVPVYNSAKFLNRCMNSLWNQTMPHDEYEIIFVDDGSTDDSGMMCDSYEKEYCSVSVIHQKNAGPAAARNAGLKKAKGTFIAFVDPDDMVDGKYLEVPYVNAIHNNADIVIFDAVRETGEDDNAKKELWNHAKYSFNSKDIREIRSMQRQILYPYMSAKASGMRFNRDIPLAAPWDKMYRRKFLIDNNIIFPEQLRVLDDMCFNFNAFSAAKNISYIPTGLYHYIVEETSITNNYREDRVQQDIKVFKYLKNSIDDMKLNKSEASRFYHALYARMIKSFAISLRLYYFNPSNPKSKKEINKELKNYITSTPYKFAFKGIRFKSLEPKLVAVTMACRLRLLLALRVMYRFQYRKLNI